MKKITLKKLSYLLLLVSIFSFGQNTDSHGRRIFGRNIQSINPSTGITKCVSSEYEEYLQENIKGRATTEEFEAWLAPKVEQVKQRMLAGKSANTVITIPVVVHVIHNGDAVGSGENISDARVLSQITVLNQDFRRMLGTPGYNTNAVGADIEIEFCMAQRKPDGTATSGIDRVNLNLASWASESSVESNMKLNTIWDPTQYFNIWVCQFSSATSADLYGVLGYAQFPSNSGLSGIDTNGGLANTDGVVIDYRAFGSSDYVTGTYFDDIDKGRTATHEIGHCFGLRHIWGDNTSCTVNATDSNKDYCSDTPAAKYENYDCLSVYNSCPTAAGNDMTENYMDYTNDACMNVFTVDQKARILAVLQNSPRRSTLSSSLACQAVLGTSSFNALDMVSIYPNPANDVLNISLGDAGDLPSAYSIYNNLGQI
ncbi:MAG: zinc metalloprotease, partial [Flavobacterium sp.]